MMQMSLVIVVKEGIGFGFQYSLRQYFFCRQEGVFSFRFQIRGVDWVQFCFSVWKCFVGQYRGSGGGGSLKFLKGRLLFFEMTGIVIYSFFQLILCFYLGFCGFLKIVFKLGRNMKDFVLMEDVILVFKVSCQLVFYFNFRLFFFLVFCLVVDYVIFLIRSFLNVSVFIFVFLLVFFRFVFKVFEV